MIRNGERLVEAEKEWRAMQAALDAPIDTTFNPTREQALAEMRKMVEAEMNTCWTKYRRTSSISARSSSGMRSSFVVDERDHR